MCPDKYPQQCQELLRFIKSALERLNPALAGAGGIKDPDTREGILSDARENDCLKLFNAAVEPFEARYGFDRFWGNFRKTMMQYYLAKREAIHEARCDLPLLRFQVNVMLVARGGIAESDGELWPEAKFTVRTNGICIESKGRALEVGYGSVVTVGREIWKPSAAGRTVAKSVDYLSSEVMSSVIFEGGEPAANDLLKHVGFMVREYRRLTRLEAIILDHLAQLRLPDAIYHKTERSVDELNCAFNRLFELRYIDKYKIITSDGLRAIESMESQPMRPLG
ncbi:MAG: hypothetical protein V1875_07755 [Candidatus Altiarchaeota archaeon]